MRSHDLTCRVREIRLVLFGEDGAGALAAAMDVPPRTWMNYEAGVMMPARVVLQFIQATAVSPHWLLTGQGPRFHDPRPAAVDDPPPPQPTRRGTCTLPAPTSGSGG